MAPIHPCSIQLSAHSLLFYPYSFQHTSLNSLSNFLSDSFFAAIFPSTSLRAETVEEEEGAEDRLTASML